MGIFYVYEHWRPDKNLPFYVGKGKNNRAYDLKNRNRHYKRVVDKLSRLGMCVEVRLFSKGLDEDKAFIIEKKRIKFWRSRGVKLVNKTDGGEGPSGAKLSKEQLLKRTFTIPKDRISKTVKELWANPEYRAKVIAAHAERPPISKSTRRKMRAAQQARRKEHKVSSNTRAKVSATIKEWHRKMGHKIS